MKKKVTEINAAITSLGPTHIAHMQPHNLYEARKYISISIWKMIVFARHRLCIIFLFCFLMCRRWRAPFSRQCFNRKQLKFIRAIRLPKYRKVDGCVCGAWSHRPSLSCKHLKILLTRSFIGNSYGKYHKLDWFFRCACECVCVPASTEIVQFITPP